MMGLSYRQQEHIGLRHVLGELAPCSAYGRDALKKLAPYPPAEAAALQTELDNLERAIALLGTESATVKRLESRFMQVKDIRASLRRCAEGGTLDEVELFEVKCYLLQLAEIGPLFATLDEAAQFEDLAFEDCTEALELLDPERNRVASFHISSRYSAALTSIRHEKKALEQSIRTAQGAEKDALLARRQEVAAREQDEEAAIRATLSAGLRPYIPALLHNSTQIARLDLLLQKAALARRATTCKPRLGADALRMDNMVNPHIEATLREGGRAFTPVSITLEAGATVITGANMGGKSVVLKTLALNTLLAHCGFFVFAQSAHLPHFDAIHLVSEDLEAAERGLSSFGGEIVRFGELAGTLGSEFPLLLLDEFARGTNPDEGAAIAWAVTGWLQTQRAFSVITTHFDHVAGAAGAHWQVAGLKGVDWAALRGEIAGNEAKLGVAAIARHMNYGLYRVDGAGEMPRDAMDICRLLGLSDKILEDAERKLLTFTNAQV